MEKAADYLTLIKLDDCVIGYWFIVPVTRDIYQRGISGENINADITPDDIPLLVKSGSYSFYFVDYILHPHHRQFEVQRLSYMSMQEQLQRLADSDFVISKMFAHTSSTDSRELCQNFGFKFVTKHKFHKRYDRNELVTTDIWELDFGTSYKDVISSNRKKLLKKYADHYRKYKIYDLIYIGECHTIEFKRFAGNFNGINRAVCGLSNSSGGTVIIGVEDSREISGIDLTSFRGSSDRFILAITDSMFSNLSGLKPQDVIVEGHWLGESFVVSIDVAQSNTTLGGETYMRVGSQTRKTN